MATCWHCHISFQRPTCGMPPIGLGCCICALPGALPPNPGEGAACKPTAGQQSTLPYQHESRPSATGKHISTRTTRQSCGFCTISRHSPVRLGLQVRPVRLLLQIHHRGRFIHASV